MNGFLNGLMAVWAFFQNNILTKPAFFVGLIVFLGYVLLRKPFYEALAGFIKATVGYMILNVAAGGLVGNFRPILAGLNQRFNLNAAVIDPYFGQAAAQAAVEGIGRSFTMMMQVLLIAFIWNLLLVLPKCSRKINGSRRFSNTSLLIDYRNHMCLCIWKCTLHVSKAHISSL